MNKILQEKRETVEKFLDEEYVLIHLDPSVSGVALPDYLAEDQSVTLKLSRYFRGKLEITDKKVKAELLFNGDYCECTIPFTAIWGCTSEKGKNLIWPEDTPKSVLAKILSSGKDGEGEETTEASSTASSSTPKSRGHLKRVK